MRFSEKWLREWVDPRISHRELAMQLTMAGLEVDQITPVAGEFSAVVVARIDSVEPHPQADKLKVCIVDDGSGVPVSVVCGAANARSGLLAPLARVGAQLPGGVTVKAANLRGTPSNGMLCSAKELALSDDDSGLFELPSGASPGRDLRELLGVDDYCIEIDLTPNRGDCLSLQGIAWDVAAINDARISPPEIVPAEVKIDDVLDVVLAGQDACPRYVGRIIRGVDCDAHTPLWMQERLRRAGLRSISPVVDVTNYVLLELGQPLHAFDLQRLSGPIGVRWGSAGERLVLLNGSTIDLDEHLLCITDDDRPVALAGLMGGLDTSVVAATHDIFLESAYFDPAAIIGRARALGMQTDAAHRFERGVDPQIQRSALERATALLLSIAGGHAGPVVETTLAEKMPASVDIVLRRQRITRLLGMVIEDAEVERILTGLGMTLVSTEEGWSVRAPSRRFDIRLEVDLIEELARIRGYRHIPEATPAGEVPGVSLPEGRLPMHRLRNVLVERGYCEAINYSFVAPAQLDPMGYADKALPLVNALSADLSVMRTSLMPGLLASLARNQHRQMARVRLFESGVCFVPGDDSVEEVTRLAGIVCGNALPEQWGQSARNSDFFDVKSDLCALLSLTGDLGDFAFAATREPWLHPGQAASIARHERVFGWVAALHPKWLTSVDVRGSVFGFELDLDVLLPRQVPNFREISRYPSIRRDIAVVVDDRVCWHEIRQSIEEIAGNLLTELVVFDEYRGGGIAHGQKSLAIGLVLQEKMRTLTDNEVDAVIESVVTRLNEDFDADLRG